MATRTAADKAALAKADAELIAELTPGMRDLLHDRARQYYYLTMSMTKMG